MLRPKMEPGRLQNRCQNRMVFKVLKKSPSEGLRGPTAEGSRAASTQTRSVLGGPLEVSKRPPGLEVGRLEGGSLEVGS